MKFAGKRTSCYREVFKDESPKAYAMAYKVFASSTGGGTHQGTGTGSG
ncbi:hypothetical protein SFC43_12985 [Bacteroides sp. CR5/BHMF/2]|nr:hypothetical protein [Bacteroides sp. CR5/BHMF/2]